MIDKKPRHPSPFKGGQAGGAFLISSFLTHSFRAEITTAVESSLPEGANGIPSLAR